jgi:hypothetical protein
VDRVDLLLEDKALAPQIVGRRRLLPKRQPALDLITARLGCFRGDQTGTVRRGGGSYPAARQPRLSLEEHRVVIELELIPRQHLLPCKPNTSIEVAYAVKRKSSGPEEAREHRVGTTRTRPQLVTHLDRRRRSSARQRTTQCRAPAACQSGPSRPLLAS